MQLATVRLGTGTSAAVRTDGGWARLPGDDLSAVLRDATPPEPGAPLVGATPVLPLPSPAKVVCCGLNYADHIAEMGRELPDHPTLFAKYADTLVGPEDDVVLPSGLDVDWEAELAVVVGAELARGRRGQAAARRSPATRWPTTSRCATGSTAPCSGSRARPGIAPPRSVPSS